MKPGLQSNLLSLSLILALLYFGKTLFIPLSFATIISLVLYPGCKWMEAKGVNRNVATAIAIATVTFFLGLIIYVLLLQLSGFYQDWASIKSSIADALGQLSSFLTDRFGFSVSKQTSLLKNLMDNSGSQIVEIIRGTAYSVSDSFFFLVMISIFSGLQLYHRRMLVNALFQIFPKEKRDTINGILSGTIDAFFNFVKGMAAVYLIVGLLNSIGLAILGISHPFIFGFIASILTFIPYFGIMIASLLPIAASWIEFNSVWYPLGVILVFSVVQFLEAYFIFPFAVGNQLKINTFAIIIMIVLGGIFWGPAGMILFIPLTSILKLIADRIKGLELLSILLGDGKTR
jgi:predicted PurR-regulated permease PerM